MSKRFYIGGSKLVYFPPRVAIDYLIELQIGPEWQRVDQHPWPKVWKLINSRLIETNILAERRRAGARSVVMGRLTPRGLYFRDREYRLLAEEEDRDYQLAKRAGGNRRVTEAQAIRLSNWRRKK